MLHVHGSGCDERGSSLGDRKRLRREAAAEEWQRLMREAAAVRREAAAVMR
jgi:hypothetical protein